MTEVTIASFNVKNLIGPDKEYYRFQTYTPEEYAWKEGWLADQIVTMNADVIGFQEIFEEEALRDTIARADELGAQSNNAALPDNDKRYRKKAIFQHLAYHDYRDASLAFAPNMHDGGPGSRRPGVAILSRLGFVEEPEIIQALDAPMKIPFQTFGDEAGGHYTIHKLSRPILKVRVPIGGHVTTVFNCHLKSKLGEYIRVEGAEFAPESDLTDYDPVGRALGAARSAMRRMAEAWVLRGAIIAELRQGRPVIVLGDFNDHENAVSSEIISGEVPFKNYEWMLRHDAQSPRDRYSAEEAAQITESIESVRLHSAEKMFVRKSLRDMVYTSAFGGVFESIDQILLSRHFTPDWRGAIGQMSYFSVLNDHENAVSSEIISGEVPFKNYEWMLRHDAQSPRDRYSAQEAAQITENIESVRLHSAEKMFVRKSLRDMVYTSAFGGVFESIDQILLSRHFTPDWRGAIGQMSYFSVLNDHLTDGSHPEAPYNKLASDHGQIMATIEIKEE
ncbi:MAG: alpha-1,4 polygalactosaminidase [Sulfitobacter sp.]|nr:alpha-1,4 polygalactosaminidase [Sulfitobacter sp.]